jgi:hypothetical protein
MKARRETAEMYCRSILWLYIEIKLFDAVNLKTTPIDIVYQNCLHTAVNFFPSVLFVQW